MALELRNVDQLALSLFDKEASYDAGPGGWLAANACSMSGYDGLAQIGDEVVDDKEGVTGSEYGTEQHIVKKDWALEFTESRLKPNTLAGLAALHFGAVSTQQDGTYTAYRHKIVPVAPGVDIPSIGAIYKQAVTQYKATGIKSNNFSLKIAPPFFSLAVGLVGSGTRASDATSFPAKISESWLRTGKIAGIWIETGANISIASPPVQGAQNISSATPDNLTARVTDFTLNHSNNLRAEDGYIAGGGDVKSTLEYGRRSGNIELKIKAASASWATELAYYENQDKMALEVHCDMGVLIDASGAFKWGFILIIPMLKLKPIARDVRDDYHIITFASDIFEDGTNDEIILYVYNAQSAYLA